VPLFFLKTVKLCNIMVGQYVSNQNQIAPVMLLCWSNDDYNALPPHERILSYYWKSASASRSYVRSRKAKLNGSVVLKGHALKAETLELKYY
jgi:hypothetical protein